MADDEVVGTLAHRRGVSGLSCFFRLYRAIAAERISHIEIPLPLQVVMGLDYMLLHSPNGADLHVTCTARLCLLLIPCRLQRICQTAKPIIN